MCLNNGKDMNFHLIGVMSILYKWKVWEKSGKSEHN